MPPLSTLRWLLPLCLVIGLVAGPARAQPRDPLLCEEDAACNQLNDEGYLHLRAERYEQARRSFEAAYAVRADPKILFNLARALHKGGRPQDAVVHYERFLQAGAAGNEELRKKAEYAVEQARTEARPAAPIEATAVGPQAPLPAPPPDTSRTRPVYKRGWFWAVLGATAASGLALGFGLAEAARRPDVAGAAEARPF